MGKLRVPHIWARITSAIEIARNQVESGWMLLVPHIECFVHPTKKTLRSFSVFPHRKCNNTAGTILNSGSRIEQSVRCGSRV
jgi:hypothetical protein